MRYSMPRLICLIVLVSAMVGSCGTDAPATEPAVVAPEAAIPEAAISVDGRLVPKATVRLAFAASGPVAEVLVRPGDDVVLGDSLVRLGGEAQAAAAVAAAELELLAAHQARQALGKQLASERVRAEQALVAARQAVREAVQQVAYLDSASPEAEAARAEARVVLAEAALEDAQEAYDDVVDRAPADLTRARLQVALADAQLAYEEAVRVAATLTELARADRLDLARDAQSAARDQVRVAEAALDRIEDAPDPDAIAAADGRIRVAEAQLAAAKTALEALTLKAPMAGTVIAVYARMGELISPAAPAVVLADLSEWWVETDTLTQIDVVSVGTGQQARVVVDALPDAAFAGEVVTVDGLFEDKRGDVTYTAHLRLDEVDSRLRWGMTCAISFETP
jgi:multidrug resistance efflux pump